jgi:hypothetical protein
MWNGKINEIKSKVKCDKKYKIKIWVMEKPIDYGDFPIILLGSFGFFYEQNRTQCLIMITVCL